MNNKKIIMLGIAFLAIAYLVLFTKYIIDLKPKVKDKTGYNNYNNITIDKILKFMDENKIDYLDNINSSFTNEDISNQNKLRFAYLALRNDIDFTKGVSYTKLETFIKNVFGAHASIKNENVLTNSKDVLLLFDKTNDIYRVEVINYNYDNIYSFYNHVIDYKIEKDRFYLIVNKFFIVNNQVYGSIDDYKVSKNILLYSNSIDEIKNYVLDNYKKIKNKLYTYVYEFTIENNSIVLLKYKKIAREELD